MNKKLLLGAALLVGFGTTLTSCVDSTESASVTAIRDAKAEQLKSIAELNKALAEKELIIANSNKAAQEADAAYKEAQAELLAAQAAYENAQAAYWQAQADALNAQTEADKAKLEYELKLLQAELDAEAQRLEQAKADLAAAQARLEYEIAQLEISLQLAQIDLATAQHNYDQMIKNAETTAEVEAAQKLNKLIREYNTAAKDLIDAKVKLAQDQMALARLQAGIEEEKNILNEVVLALNDRNDAIQNEIVYWQGVLNTYQQYAGQEVTLNMLEDSYLALVKAQVAANDFQPQVTDAQNAYNAAQADVFASAYAANIQELLNNAAGQYSVYDDKKERTEIYSFNIEVVNGAEIPAASRGLYNLTVSHYQTGINNGNMDDTKADEITTYTPAFGIPDFGVAELADGSTYQVVNNYYNLVNDGAGLNAWLDCKLAQLKNGAENNGLESFQEGLANAKKYLANAETKLTNAKTAYNNAVKASETAEGKMDEAEDAYDAAQANVTAKNAAYTAALAAFNEIAEPTEGDQAKVTAALAALQDARQGVTDAYDAYNQAEQAYNDAVQAEMDAEYAKYLAIKSVDYGELWVDAAQKDLNSAEVGDLTNKNEVALWTNLVKDIIAGAAENETSIAANNDAAKALAEKNEEYMALEDAATTAKSEWETLKGVFFEGNGIVGGNEYANNAVDAANTIIDACNQDIAYNKQMIDWINDEIAKIESGETYGEAIMIAQALVDKDQIDLDTKQQLFDIAKAALDAALADAQK